MGDRGLLTICKHSQRLIRRGRSCQYCLSPSFPHHQIERGGLWTGKQEFRTKIYEPGIPAGEQNGIYEMEATGQSRDADKGIDLDAKTGGVGLGLVTAIDGHRRPSEAI
ncbi:hypothetical protein E4U21_003328 [Claviceps maximensis]|nr:hypothetical protein E4U21_003328 [Claviceps maximensis]